MEEVKAILALSIARVVIIISNLKRIQFKIISLRQDSGITNDM